MNTLKTWFARLYISQTVAASVMIVSVLLIGVVTTATIWNYYHPTHLGIVPVPADLLAKRNAQVQSLMDSGAYTEVHTVAHAASVSAQNNSEAYELSLDEGTAAEQKQDYAAALKAYQQAQKIYNNYTATAAVGRVAEKMGNKPLASSSYQAALQLIVLGPLADSQRAALEARIKTVNE